jgi:hypothetical protein
VRVPESTSRSERFQAHLDAITGGAEPRLLPVPSTQDGLDDVTVAAYPNLPEDLYTAITYGVSVADHPDWQSGRPELCLSVRSTDDRWAEALGWLVERLRGQCPFRYGDVIRLEAPITAESPMTAFLVFASTVLDPETCRVEVGPPDRPDSDIIHLYGIYPIHQSEAEYIGLHGLEPFWRLDWDRHDVTRPPAV